MKPIPPKPLVIGYGNLMRGDDAVGPHVAANVGGIAAHQLLPEMAETIANEDAVIFVDARLDVAPGKVKIVQVDEEGVLTHHASPGWLLKLAREIYGQAPRATLVGIGVASFELGARMSPLALRGARAAIRHIRSIQIGR